jgi:prepilin signal peptidase PulO-like enzyme (type II secretory pathway)
LSRNESGRFGALKSDSTHHFFRNACTKSGSLRFSVFRLLTDFVCLYTYEFWLSLCKIVRSSVILLLPLFVLLYFFFWPLCCLFFFDIRILIAPLVSSNSSLAKLITYLVNLSITTRIVPEELKLARV